MTRMDPTAFYLLDLLNLLLVQRHLMLEPISKASSPPLFSLHVTPTMPTCTLDLYIPISHLFRPASGEPVSSKTF